MKWKAVTEGERLFDFIGVQLRAVAKRSDISPWESVESLLSVASRGSEFSAFFQFITVLHIQAKAIALVKGLYKENKLQGTEPTLKQIAACLSEEFSFCTSKELVNEFSRHVQKCLEKVDEYQGVIPNRFKKKLFPEGRQCNCYICGTAINGDDGSGDLDHIWPRSLGGDTIAENLIPACKRCNREKDDLPTWAWGLVQSTFLGASDTEEKHAQKIDRIPGKTKISIYLRRLFLEAEENSLTLKVAASRIGPSQGVAAKSTHFLACDFFDLSPILST